MNKPISIVIPLYNKERCIGKTICSVLDQSYTNFELVIVDDGSTDQSLNKVKKFEDERIRIIQQRNLGISAAKNAGISHSKYELVAFLDADDYWEKTFLQTIISLVDEFPQAGLYSTGYYLHYDSGTITKTLPMQDGNSSFIIKNYFKELLNNSWGLHTSSVVIWKHVLKDLGKFPIWIESPCNGYIYILRGDGTVISRAEMTLSRGKSTRLRPNDPIMLPEELRLTPDLQLRKDIHGEDMYLWDYIGLKYPIAYCNSLLSNYSGDVPGQAVKAKRDEACSLTLRNLYCQLDVIRRSDSVYYIKKYMRKMLFSKISQTINGRTYGNLIYCLDINHADYLIPILNYLSHHRIFYPILYLVIIYKRYKYSKKVFKFIPKRLAGNFLSKIGIKL